MIGRGLKGIIGGIGDIVAAPFEAVERAIHGPNEPEDLDIDGKPVKYPIDRRPGESEHSFCVRLMEYYEKQAIEDRKNR